MSGQFKDENSTEQRLTVGSLFAGIGGFDLGLERAGMKVIWQSEIDPYASAVLKKHWPEVPNLGDIRTISRERIARGSVAQFIAENPREYCKWFPDVLCGGFPCQDISIAWNGPGIDGSRSGLWSEFARIIGELRPRYAIMENVSALLGRGLERVLGDLAALGYDAEWHCIPASAVGAPHERDRVWIVAHTDVRQRVRQIQQVQPGWDAACGRRETVAHADGERCYEMEQSIHDRASSERTIFAALHAGLAGRRGRWEAEPDLGRVAYGVPSRVDRLRCLGNSIVPQIAEVIGRAIVQREQSAKFL